MWPASPARVRPPDPRSPGRPARVHARAGGQAVLFETAARTPNVPARSPGRRAPVPERSPAPARSRHAVFPVPSTGHRIRSGGSALSSAHRPARSHARPPTVSSRGPGRRRRRCCVPTCSRCCPAFRARTQRCPTFLRGGGRNSRFRDGSIVSESDAVHPPEPSPSASRTARLPNSRSTGPVVYHSRSRPVKPSAQMSVRARRALPTGSPGHTSALVPEGSRIVPLRANRVKGL
ncbi:MAG: hypothetical protein AVDCRST_MAG43-373 [uncultured Thermomicrobiales bacterium]|uniref:Uncharacterized protein n=1 Tax=uncultured Thermomicrobiales bacterium TaxID=1645740 RepID=A0A6J4U898_9BACT|nr:MAG: hypothetical protein AVDCRST_MAG43-373 [uncultured Thermomicrobiales bacterium]